MTFTAKPFIVCDLERREADLLWPTVMPFNTVINPDTMMATVSQGPPLATLLPCFCPRLLSSAEEQAGKNVSWELSLEG